MNSQDTYLLDQTDLPKKPNDRRFWYQLPGSSQALATALTTEGHDGLILIITKSTQDAHTLTQELRFFLDSQTDPAAGEVDIIHFPDWETLPYDNFSPHEDITSERIRTLYELPRIQRGIVTISHTTLMHRLPPLSFIGGHSLVLEVGQELCIRTMREQLNAAAYRCVDTVFEHGEYAVRGSIMDIFPMGSHHPYRIDLFDEEIDTIRTFDPETQRSIDKTEQVRLLPAREFPLTDDAIAHFKSQFIHRFDVNPKNCPLYQDIQSGLASAGIEYYLPLFFESTATLFDYLPQNTLVFTPNELESACNHFWEEINTRYEQHCVDPQRPIVPPREVFLGSDDCFSALKNFPRITLQEGALETPKPGKVQYALATAPDLTINSKSSIPLNKVKAHIDQVRNDGGRLLLCAESAGRRETLLELLQTIQEHPKSVANWKDFLTSSESFSITVGALNSGFELQTKEGHLSVISESQLFGQRVMQQRRRKKTSDEFTNDNIVKNLTELKEGEPVVHLDHGVGRYLGLQTLTVEDQAQEFLTLEYAKGAKLYVPVASLHLIARYGGVEAAMTPLHKLGSEQWQKEKRKASEKICDTAAELLNIYARRAAREGKQHSIDRSDYELFAAGFPFEETVDQQTAIDAVIQDMESPQPMDRLVCGDVGFGKTEVAMRATFIALQSNLQVAVLVPTTLLAQQHFESFKDRFADWPVKVELLSRFRTNKEQQEVIDQLDKGNLDIVIGTHKLIQKNIKFARLGLVIVDEEHRFGVRHKEQLKSLRSEVDILTLTATPIPRTLNMAMSGIRDISIIATPPAKRLSIKTFVREYHAPVVKEAILRELLRGGQVYYLHNEVKSIEKTADTLRQLVPEARISVAHGQMRERELEQIMSDFYHKRFNVLVCTTIIETGIDIPTANTIIMDRADKLGLAQLHQLRGRVGRSHHQAYAYLLTPHPKAMSQDAVKRLEAIADADDLGAGFTLASHDLEIRGTGELLGDEQSGHIQSIGFTLYMELLDHAVKSIREGKTPDLDKPFEQGPEVNLRLPSLIPDDYIHDVHTRLIMYKRIASASNEAALTELKVEIIDRFGLLPDPLLALFRVTQLKLLAGTLGIAKIDAGPESGRIEFGADPQVHPLVLVKLVQNQPQKYKLEGADRLRFTLPMEERDQRFAAVEQLLDILEKKEP